MYWSIGLITIIGTLGVFCAAGPIINALAQVPDKLWDLMTYGIGAFVLGRSVEKAVTNYRRGGDG